MRDSSTQRKQLGAYLGSRNMSNSSSSGGGIGICGVLTIIFIVLKLCKVAPIATWSWWWVFSPLWIGFLLVFGILALVLLIAAIASK